MSFGQNLQFLRRMRRGMTQEDLAERMNVSRQTVSKWETGEAYPEMDKAAEICGIFSCTMDALFREDMGAGGEAFSNLRIEKTGPFSYVRYAVISPEPERDALSRIRDWAREQGIREPDVIGWDFPHVSQEQINVFHMHGYAAACILPEGFQPSKNGLQVISQPEQDYAVITVRDPFKAPFTLIPSAYKALMAYVQANGRRPVCREGVVGCYEKTYTREGIDHMDVYIAVED